jgi:hypothetical protein
MTEKTKSTIKRVLEAKRDEYRKQLHETHMDGAARILGSLISEITSALDELLPANTELADR